MCSLESSRHTETALIKYFEYIYDDESMLAHFES